jgi:hypothetical protein
MRYAAKGRTTGAVPDTFAAFLIGYLWLESYPRR